MRWAGCQVRDGHTCKMLSSATEAITQSSEGFQAKSETLEVWPPWMNSSSGGPSSASSGVCSMTHTIQASTHGTAQHRAATPLLHVHPNAIFNPDGVSLLMLHQGWGLPEVIVTPSGGSKGLQRPGCILKNRVHAVRRRTTDLLLPNAREICQQHPLACSAGGQDNRAPEWSNSAFQSPKRLA